MPLRKEWYLFGKSTLKNVFTLPPQYYLSQFTLSIMHILVFYLRCKIGGDVPTYPLKNVPHLKSVVLTLVNERGPDARPCLQLTIT